MNYNYDRYADDDYSLDDENQDNKRHRRNKRGKHDRDSLEGRDRKWDRWN